MQHLCEELTIKSIPYCYRQNSSKGLKYFNPIEAYTLSEIENQHIVSYIHRESQLCFSGYPFSSFIIGHDKARTPPVMERSPLQFE